MNSPENPYAPPQAEISAQRNAGEGAPLARPGRRLVAVIIDGLVLLVINRPLLWLTGYSGWVAAAANSDRAFVPTLEGLIWTAVGFFIFAAVNWVFLQEGQTIGKRAMGLRILRKDGRKIDAVTILLRRFLPVQIVSLIPWIGGLIVLIDCLMIFRAKHNTLHDDVADTMVVWLNAPANYRE